MKYFTSESVTEGHPDKLCDRISDTILDEHIRGDKFSRVACETLASGNMIVVTGEITSSVEVVYENIVRKVVRDVGYEDAQNAIDWRSLAVISFIKRQSEDIAIGVLREGGEIGAGDQGMMFGFATLESESFFPSTYMPLPILLAHKLCQRLDEVRKSKIVDFLRPDGKSQVTVEYEEDRPKRVVSVVVSSQHSPDANLKELRDFIIEEVIKSVIPKSLLSPDTKFFINPTGRFVIGGPLGDAGLTGRKIIVDTYGGYSRHGGGAFSGKDPTKVDRSGSYLARYIAKNIVAAGIAKKCEVNIAYVIGVPEPVHISVETYGTSKISDERIVEVIKNYFPLKPKDIIERLDLRRPIYSKTSVYGHFGRNDFPWEKTDIAEILREELS